MKIPATPVFIALLAAASCSRGDVSPIAPLTPSVRVPPPPPPPAPPAPPVTQIILGAQVQGVLAGHGAENRFELTASATGTLVARVLWEGQALIAFGVDGRWVAQDSSSPLVARAEVTKGETYLLVVADGAPWDYGGFVVPYVLRTTIDPPTP